VTRTPKDPRTDSPRAVRAAQATPGGPAAVTVPRGAAAGGTNPQPSLSRPAVVTGTAPASGTEGPAITPPVPGRGPKTPAGASENDSPPAGSSGAEWRKKVKAATSALHAAQRRGAHKYTRVADRTAGSQYRPGMAVRKPPEPPEDAA
jgi:hypothetical protein